jgi:predicted short-subunit dehydrogenase-like oxidoreductase (DUF2520 family)
MDFICRCSDYDPDYASSERYAGSGSLVQKTEHPFEGPVGIAGTGRIAKALGALIARRGVDVRAVGGRCLQSGEDAVGFIGAGQAVSIRELPRYARRIVIAVTDAAIPEVAAELVNGGLRDGIVLHTSGASGMEVLNILRPAENAGGVIHPLMTVPSAERGVETLPGATYAFAGNGGAPAWAESLIVLLGGKALSVDPKFWQHYHAGAVMACNYQMALVDSALELMEIAGIGRNAALGALGPILRATMDNILTDGPERALTGPISRGDVGTVRRHVAAVNDASPETRRLYTAGGLRTVAVAERAGLEASAAREIERALEGAL